MNFSNKYIYFLIVVVLVIFASAFMLINTQKDDDKTYTSADNAPPGSIHNLPVPEAVSAVKSYVASQENLEEGMIIVLSAYEMEWSDSCLGLGGPAESCLAAITPGYEVTVQFDGKEKVFRTNEDGSQIRLEE